VLNTKLNGKYPTERQITMGTTYYERYHMEENEKQQLSEDRHGEVSLLADPHKMGTSEVEEKKTVLFDVILCLALS
jgi:hypothetical protein